MYCWLPGHNDSKVIAHTCGARKCPSLLWPGAIEPSGFSIDWVSEVVLTFPVVRAVPIVEVLPSIPPDALPQADINSEAEIFLCISIALVVGYAHRAHNLMKFLLWIQLPIEMFCAVGV